MHDQDYALCGVHQAIRILSEYQIGNLKSVEYNPDKVQISPRRFRTNWENCNKSFQIDAESSRMAIWVQCCLALKELKSIYNNNERFKVFVLCEIGVLDPNSDTKDKIFKSREEVAKALGKKPDTIYRWTAKVRKDFTEILQNRNIIPQNDDS